MSARFIRNSRRTFSWGTMMQEEGQGVCVYSDTHIPEEALPKLFEAFYRVDASRSRQTGGSGLGLYIVQKILQQHNSYCNVRNTQKGVEFFFEFPKIM